MTARLRLHCRAAPRELDSAVYSRGPRFEYRDAPQRTVRMAKRYGHIRPEVQRQALDAVATAEIGPSVNQIVHQAGSEVESGRPN